MLGAAGMRFVEVLDEVDPEFSEMVRANGLVGAILFAERFTGANLAALRRRTDVVSRAIVVLVHAVQEWRAAFEAARPQPSRGLSS